MVGCRRRTASSLRRNVGTCCRVEAHVESPDVAVEIADVRLGDEPRVGRAGRDRVRLQRVLDRLAPVVPLRSAVVDGLARRRRCRRPGWRRPRRPWRRARRTSCRRRPRRDWPAAAPSTAGTRIRPARRTARGVLDLADRRDPTTSRRPSSRSPSPRPHIAAQVRRSWRSKLRVAIGNAHFSLMRSGVGKYVSTWPASRRCPVRPPVDAMSSASRRTSGRRCRRALRR